MSKGQRWANDRTLEQDWDLPAEGSSEASPAEQNSSELSSALLQKKELSDLTESKAWAKLLIFVQEQIKPRTDTLLITPVKHENIDEMNFLRGEIAGLKLLEAYIQQTMVVADNVIDLMRAAQKEDGNV